MQPDQQFTIAWILLVLAALVILIDVGLFLAWAFRKDEVDAGIKPPLFARTWSLVDVWIAAQAIFIILMVSQVGALPFFFSIRDLMSGKTSKILGSPGYLLVIQLAQNAAFVLVPALIITKKYRMRLRDIGLPNVPAKRDILLGIGLGVGLMMMSGIVQSFFGFVLVHTLGASAFKHLEDITKALTAEGVMGKHMSFAMFATMFFAAGIAAPIGEEVLFRGFLYNSAKRRFGVAAAVVLSAAIFALIHLGPLAVVVIVFMGAALALAYEYTGSLWVTIIMHATNNCTLVLFTYLASRGGR